MLELIGVDGLTQWDVGRQVKVDKDIDMVHFSNRPYGYSKNVKVTDGVADVPDMFLTSCAPLHIWAYIGNFEKGYTKIEKIYEVKPKNRPEDYIYTPEEIKTWEKLQSEIGDLSNLETKAKENLVVAINEAAKSGGESYILPQATANALGGVKADSAEAADTQPVRIGGDGKLYTAPGVTDISTKMDANNPVGTGSFSMNRKAGTVVGVNSHAEGTQTTASSSSSHAEGSDTTASGSYSHAEGYSTTARENYSHAEGSNTTASGEGSHAEGYHTTASGQYSHAEGNNTIASGKGSHAEGTSTKAHGGDSHAEGYNTTASGNDSHAEGYHTTANGNNSHVQGKCNIADTSNKYADIIGNGTSDTARSNAATVDWSGNAWFAGDIYTGSTSGTNKDDGSKKLATEEYVNSSIAAGGTDISLGLTSAAVGQIIKVKAIDASGKPTAWEAADMAGGGEHWEKITEIELTDAASLITINQDANGKPFALKRVMIDCTINIDQDNAMTYVKTLLNGFPVCANKSFNFAASATGYYAFYAELIPGSGALVWQIGSGANYNWYDQIQKMGYKYNDIWKSNAITSLTISPNDGGKNFGIAGTKIAVQGVRA